MHSCNKSQRFDFRAFSRDLEAEWYKKIWQILLSFQVSQSSYCSGLPKQQVNHEAQLTFHAKFSSCLWIPVQKALQIYPVSGAVWETCSRGSRVSRLVIWSSGLSRSVRALVCCSSSDWFGFVCVCAMLQSPSHSETHCNYVWRAEQERRNLKSNFILLLRTLTWSKLP